MHQMQIAHPNLGAIAVKNGEINQDFLLLSTGAASPNALMATMGIGILKAADDDRPQARPFLIDWPH